MKFGKKLEAQARPEWKEHYIDYNQLKKLIKEVAKRAEIDVPLSFSPRITSLTYARGTQDNADTFQAKFFMLLNKQAEKVGNFTTKLIKYFREELSKIKDKLDVIDSNDENAKEEIFNHAKKIGDEFLGLEKFVNLNYLGFHKILKKHDKNIPQAPCYEFFMSHLHCQPWIQESHGDLLVLMSEIHSKVRNDSSGIKDDKASQEFVRSTMKFWVKGEDISAVKHHILQNLPVFQFEKDNFSGDAQLISSVYLDNSSLQLYHGRLDKRPNAIAIRIRWYGSNDPRMVFVERKTHRDSWTGEVSVKERISLKEEDVVDFLEGRLNVEDAIQDLIGQRKSEKEVENFRKLFLEMQQQVDSKQLQPMIRTSYMRTAFQIPYDASVRISLDTNLMMMKENPEDSSSCAESGRWCRDPNIPILRTDATNFPHGILEIKLSLKEGESRPHWVEELLQSGYLIEVHKFSKFIHGTATLLPEMIQAVPYWIDDESLKSSILVSSKYQNTKRKVGAKKHVNPNVMPSHSTYNKSSYSHPIIEDDLSIQLIPHDTNEKKSYQRNNVGEKNIFIKVMEKLLIWDCYPKTERRPLMRLEPKVFFANERTFMSWMEMSVTVGAIASILLGLASGDQEGLQMAELTALILLPLSIVMAIYAVSVFWWRSSKIAKKQVDFIHDEVGTVLLGLIMLISMTIILAIALVDYLKAIYNA